MMHTHLVFLEAIYGCALALGDQRDVRDVTIAYMPASLPNSFTGLNIGRVLHNSRILNNI